MTETKKKRGFAAMDPEKRRKASSKGGKASQATGTAHRFTSKEARDAGEKSGVVEAKPKTSEELATAPLATPVGFCPPEYS